MMKRYLLYIILCMTMLPIYAQQTKVTVAAGTTIPAPQACIATTGQNHTEVGGKKVDVKITGTLMEPVTMRLPTGEVETVNALPYTFKVYKNELPMQIMFESASYTYTPIVVNKKEIDGGVGRTYVLKKQQKMVAQQNVIVQQTAAPAVAPEVKSAPAIDWSHGVNVVPSTNISSENTFALIIANEEYEMVAPVAMANFDGEVFKAYCEKTLGLSKHQIKYYPNASYGKMTRAFREIKDIAQAFDGDINLIIYYAGHGIPDNASKDAYLMPIDADGTDTGICYSLKSLYKDIDNLHLNQCVVFMDACFSGAKRDGDMIVAARGVAIKAKEEKPKSATIVFSATSDEEAAYSYQSEKHGLFTYCLLKKLQESKGNVTLGDLADYLTKNVRQKSIVINGKKQTPTIIASDDIMQKWRSLKLTK